MLRSKKIRPTVFRMCAPQITAGAVAWDVTEQDLPSCETLSREGNLEPIDYSIVDTTGIPEELIQENYIGFIQLHQSDRVS